MQIYYSDLCAWKYTSEYFIEYLVKTNETNNFSQICKGNQLLKIKFLETMVPQRKTLPKINNGFSLFFLDSCSRDKNKNFFQCPVLNQQQTGKMVVKFLVFSICWSIILVVNKSVACQGRWSWNRLLSWKFRQKNDRNEKKQTIFSFLVNQSLKLFPSCPKLITYFTKMMSFKINLTFFWFIKNMIPLF